MGSFVLKTLEEVGTFYNGVTGKSKEDFVDGNAKFITYMNIFKNPSLRTDVEDTIRITEGECQNTVQYGDILFTTSSETPDECGMSSVLEIQTNEPLYLNSFCFGFRFNDLSNIIPGFYKHLFRSSRIRAQIAKTANGVTRFNVSKKLFAKIQIPLPPLPIQQLIVEILDKFTSLVSSLDSEIALRQKQYEYYRNKLLSFEEGEEGVEWKKLSDVCIVINGRAYKQSELLDKGPYRVLRVGNFFSNDSWYYSDLELESKYYCVNGDLLYAWSASFGPHIWKEEKVIYHYHIWKLECQEPLDKKFMFYWLQSDNMTSQVSSEKHGATMAHLTKAMMEDLSLPIPSLDRQRSIVRTLDTFESLLTNLKKERELRQKQYEYYREKLLTFA